MRRRRPQRPPSNFAFLKATWPDLAREAMKAERNAAADPRRRCFYARRALELAVHWLYDADRVAPPPLQGRPSAMVFEPSFQAAVDQRIRAKMDFIRRQGNAAVHDRRPIKAEAALGVVRELFHVMFWLARTYARDPERRAASRASRSTRRRSRGRSPPSSGRRRSRRCAQAGRETRARDDELERARADNAALQAELERAARGGRRREGRERGAARRPRLRRGGDPRPLHRPAAARGRLAARRAARPRVRGRRACRTSEGMGFVDYVLWGDDG